MAPVEIDRAGWRVVVPVKVLATAKSRLAPHVGGLRRELALAMAIDTVNAVAACEDVEVIVVTDDPDAAAALALVARVVPDRPGSGINAALRHGAAASGRRAVRLAAVQADLPSLQPAELAAALRGATRPRPSYLSDASGTGTTFYASPTLASFRPRFGPASAQAHSDVADELLLDVPTLRRDVDTIADLWAAVRLGVGPCTTALLPSLPVRSA